MKTWVVGLALVGGLVSFARAEDEEPPPVPALPAMVGVKAVTATSEFADKKKPDRHAAWRVLDFEPDSKGNPVTAWCEGKADEGIGESVTIDFGAPTKLDSIQIAAGFWKTDKLWKANNVITGLDVTIDGTTQSLKPTKRGAWLKVATKQPVTTFTIKITAATKGKMNDSCISGVKLMKGKAALKAMVGLDSAAAQALLPGIKKLQEALAKSDYKALEKLLEFPFSYDDSANFSMGGQAVTHKTFKAMVAACKADVPDDENYVCPGPEWPNREDGASIVGGSGGATLTWPSGNEVIPTWDLVWKGGVWKLAGIGYTGAGGPDMGMPEE